MEYVLLHVVLLKLLSSYTKVKRSLCCNFATGFPELYSELFLLCRAPCFKEIDLMQAVFSEEYDRSHKSYKGSGVHSRLVL